MRERKGRGRKRERDEEDRVERVGELEPMREKRNNIYIDIYILEYYYSTILTLELYCSTIANRFAIVGFTIF